MDNTFSSSAWLNLGRIQFAHGNLHGAVEMFKRALSEDPDDADAHAVLALVLLRQKRLHAAEHEAQLALTLEAELPLAHAAAASVALARRQFSRAEGHLQRLLELEPQEPDNLRLQARFYGLTGKQEQRREALMRALSFGPDDPYTLTALGDEALERGDLVEAERRARETLAADAQFLDGLVLMGQVHVRRGQLEEARDHALWALRQNASDPGALRLLVEIQARKSWVLGLWWRWATWMGTLSDTRGMLVLLGAFAAQRVATQAALDLEAPTAATLIMLVWLGIVAYSWIGPSLFNRMLERELKGVKLDERF